MLLSRSILSMTACLASMVGLTSAAAVNVRDAKPNKISASLDDIAGRTEALGQTVSSWNGGLLGTLPILGKAATLYLTIRQSTRVVEMAKPLSQDETIALVGKVQTLDDKVTKTFKAIFDAAPKFKRLFLTFAIRLNLLLDKDAVEGFIGNLLIKVPKDLRDLAKSLAKPIVDKFDKVIAEFS
ncbi:hypothetical protein CP533_5895 [Ophiocordyceps camponoti-saundersi (nom. inval.)]|nr:hypothetical protein CP533_5895 [Ophiocordyceps camponoti-saundersi (nom. inval.)]